MAALRRFARSGTLHRLPPQARPSPRGPRLAQWLHTDSRLMLVYRGHHLVPSPSGVSASKVPQDLCNFFGISMIASARFSLRSARASARRSSAFSRPSGLTTFGFLRALSGPTRSVHQPRSACARHRCAKNTGPRSATTRPARLGRLSRTQPRCRPCTPHGIAAALLSQALPSWRPRSRDSISFDSELLAPLSNIEEARCLTSRWHTGKLPFLRGDLQVRLRSTPVVRVIGSAHAWLMEDRSSAERCDRAICVQPCRIP